MTRPSSLHALGASLLVTATFTAACGDGASKDTAATGAAATGAAATAAAAPATGAPPPSGGVTIRMGPDGRAQVDGAGPPAGDPKACAALAACCTAPPMSLFCSLTQANGGSCEQQLATVQAHLAETKTAKPPGCP